MIYLIDGFNLIYKFPHLEEKMYQGELNSARDGLMEILKESLSIKKRRYRVVFDGKRNISDTTRREKKGTIDVYYSLDYSADHLIKEFIKKDSNPRMTTVVTSDKEILFYVNRFRARTMKSEDFARMITQELEEAAKPSEPEKPSAQELSEDEISFWEKLFKNTR